MSDDTELKVGISVDSTTDQGFSTEEARLDAFVASVDRMSSMFTAGNDRIVESIDKIGAKLDETRQRVEKVKQPVTDLEESMNRLGGKFEKAFSFGGLVEEVGGKILGVVGLVALAEKGFELMGEAAHEAFDFIKEGVGYADKIRDLHLSIESLKGGVVGAAAAWDLFEQAEKRTRNTAEELATEFRKIEPLATSKGFTEQGTAQLTEWMSQLSTVRGVDLSTMESGLMALLAGRVTVARNQLLQALGIKKEDVDKLGWADLIAKIEESAAHFAVFGDSVESTLHKAKVALLEDFADGFNGARGEAEKGMGAIKDLVADPKIKEAVVALGSATASWVATLAGAITELKGIALWLHEVSDSPFFKFLAGGGRVDLAIATGGLSEVARLIPGATKEIGFEGNAQSDFDNGQRASLARLQAGSAAFRKAGMITGTGAVPETATFHTDVPGQGNPWQEIFSQVGQVAQTLPDKQFAAFMDILKSDVADMKAAGKQAQLNLDDIARAKSDALKESGIDVPPGLVKAAADKSKQDAKAAMEDYIHTLEDGLKLETLHITNQEKIANAVLGRSTIEKAEADLDFAYQKTVAGLTEKQLAAEAQLQQARAFGTPQDVARYQSLIAATKAETDEATKAHDALKALAEDNFFRQMDDQSAKQALADQAALDRASKALSPHEAAMSAIDTTSAERVLKITEQLRDATVAWQYAWAHGNTADILAADVEYQKLVQAKQAAEDFHASLSAITEDEFWRHFADENRKALDDAETKVTDFADKWGRALDSMSPALAASARAQIANIGEQIAAEMLAIEQFQLAASSPVEFGGLGLAVDNPELVRRVAMLRQQVGENANVSLTDDKALTTEINKVQVEAAKKALDVWQNNLGSIFSSAAEGGAKGFIQAMAGDFKGLVAAGGKDLSGILSGLLGFGTPGNPNQAAFGTDAQGYPVYLGQQQPGQFYKDGHLVTSTGAKYATAGLQFAEVGVGAYAAGASSTGPGSGALLGGTLSGGIAGAGIGAEIGAATFNVVGAVVGAVVGMIVGYVGSYLGELSAKDKWQFFQPQFGAGVGLGGAATGSQTDTIALGQVENLNAAQQAQVIAQITGVIDKTNDSLITLVEKLGQKIPTFDISKLTGISSGPGQPNYGPRSDFMQDFNAWLTDTLPKEVEAQYTDTIGAGFEKLGMSSAKFKSIWDALDKVDPTKTIALLSTLADALNSIDQSMAAFTAADPLGISMGSNLFGVMTGQLGLAKTQSYAQQIQGTPKMDLAGGKGYQDATGDYNILDFAAQIRAKSAEGQIADEATLAQMLKARYDAEKAAITAIFNLATQAKTEFQSDLNNIAVQGMTKVQNGQLVPDYAAQADFFKGQSDSDLTRIQTAHNATEEQNAWEQFRQDVMSAGNAAINQANQLADPNARKKAIQDVLDWEKSSLGIGQNDLQTNLTKMGTDLDRLNDTFVSKLIPSLDGLTGALDNLTPYITPPKGPGPDQNPSTPKVPYYPQTGDVLVGTISDGTTATVNAIGDMADRIIAAIQGNSNNSNSGVDPSAVHAFQIVTGRMVA